MADFQSVESMNNDAQAGWDAMQAEARKAAAYNALRKTYGDVAGDPTSALQLQKYGFDQQNNPMVLQGNALANSAAQQKAQFDEQDDPLRLQADRDKNANNVEVIKGNQLDNAAKQQAATAQHAQMLHGVFSGTLDGLEKEGADMVDPAQLGALFDRHAATIANLAGADDPSTQAELAKERARFVAGGVGAIPGMRADLDAATQAVMSPKDIQAQKLGNIQLEKAQADAESSRSKATAAAAKAAGTAPGAGLNPGELDKRVLNWTKINGKPDDIRGKIDAVRGVDSKISTMIGNGAVGGFKGDPDRVKQFGPDGLIQQSLGLLDKVKDLSSWQRHLQAFDKNSDVFKLQNNLQQIADSTALADLQNLKAGGTSLGRVTNAEFSSLSKALINANSDADYKTLKSGLNNVGDFFMKLHNAAGNSVIARTGQLAGYRNLVRGTVYADPNDPDQAAPAAGLTSPTPGGAAGGIQTPAGSGATSAPVAAPDPNNPATVTPQQLQQQGVLTPDAPAAGVQKVDLEPPKPGFIPHANYANNSNMGNPASPGWVQQNIVPVSVDGAKFQVNKQAAPAFQAFLSDLAAEGYPIKSSGGYNYRTIRGSDTGRLSQHAYGNAIDINADANPQGGSKSDLPSNVAQLAASHGLIWGGKFSGSKKDPMHFEWAGPNAGGVPAGTPIQPDTSNSVPGDGPQPPADQQTVASAGAPAGGGNALAGGMQQTADATPRGEPAPTAKAGPADSSGAGKLQGMSPMQVAQTPVPLPSAADIVSPYNNALKAGSGKQAHVLGDVASILAHYGLRKKT